MNEFKDFYSTLIENLNSYDNEYPAYINCGPNLFNLLCELLNQNEVDKNMRLKISAAIAYYVASNDIIPEEIYGPYGYIDDIFVASYVLKEVINEYGLEFIEKLWYNNSSVSRIIDECYEKSLNDLDDNVYSVLSYVGLID